MVYSRHASTRVLPARPTGSRLPPPCSWESIEERQNEQYDRHRDVTLYEAVGCKECNFSGFRGRRAITEFLDLTDRIRELILEKRPSSEVRKVAIAEGMTTLRQSAIEKVLAGETTLKEINRVTFIE